MLRLLALALFSLITSVSLTASALPAPHQMQIIGNGGGYSGVPPFSYDGPFFLMDPFYVCPTGSIGPAKPGYREVIRLDHFGPAGCAGDTCRDAVYVRQNACTGAAIEIGQPRWEKSERYEVSTSTGVQFYGFNLMAFEGQLYLKQAELPNPSYLPALNEAWCTNGDYEVLIARSASNAVTASVYYAGPLAKQPGPQDPPYQYTLYSISNLPVTRTTSEANLITYSGLGLTLEIPGGALLQTTGTLTLTQGKPQRLSVRCVMPTR